MTPAGTSNELDVQNGWEENTHTHTHTKSVGSVKEPSNFLIYTAYCCSASNLTFHAFTHNSNQILRRRYHIRNRVVFRRNSVSKRVHCPYKTRSSGPFSVALCEDRSPRCLVCVDSKVLLLISTVVGESGGPRSRNKRSTPWGVLSAHLCADGSRKTRGNAGEQLTAGVSKQSLLFLLCSG